jgi:hypothetical protein
MFKSGPIRLAARFHSGIAFSTPTVALAFLSWRAHLSGRTSLGVVGGDTPA